MNTYARLKAYCLRHGLEWRFDTIYSPLHLIWEIIKLLNTVVTDMDDLKVKMDDLIASIEGTIEQEVIDKLLEWKNDGSLETLINDALFNQKADIEYVEHELSSRFIPGMDYFVDKVENENGYITDLHVVTIPYENADGSVNVLKQGFGNGGWEQGYESAISFDLREQTALTINGGFLTYENMYSKVIHEGQVLTDVGAGAIRPDIPNLLAWGVDGVLKTFNHSTNVNSLTSQGISELLMAQGKIVENNYYDENWWKEAGLSPNINVETHPRTVIAQLNNNDYVVIVCAGREPLYWENTQQGIGMLKMAEYLVSNFGSKGVKIAFNLDGGGSSQMVVNGREVLTLHDNYRTKRREVGNFIYFKREDKENTLSDGTLNALVQQIRVLSKDIVDIKTQLKNYDAIDWTNTIDGVETYNIDEIKKSGLYYISSNFTTLPAGSSGQQVLFVMRTNVNRVIQVLFPVIHSSATEQYLQTRSFFADTNTWQPWYRATLTKVV